MHGCVRKESVSKLIFDYFQNVTIVLACARLPLTPQKSGRGHLCVAFVNRVPSHMTLRWICGKDADWLVNSWGSVQDG